MKNVRVDEDDEEGLADLDLDDFYGGGGPDDLEDMGDFGYGDDPYDQMYGGGGMYMEGGYEDMMYGGMGEGMMIDEEMLAAMFGGEMGEGMDIHALLEQMGLDGEMMMMEGDGYYGYEDEGDEPPSTVKLTNQADL